MADISFEGAAFWCKLNFRQAGWGTIWGTKLNCEFLFRLIDKEVLIGRSRAEASGPADKMDHISVSHQKSTRTYGQLTMVLMMRTTMMRI